MRALSWDALATLWESPSGCILWGYFSEGEEGREAVGREGHETGGSHISLTNLCALCPTTSKSIMRKWTEWQRNRQIKFCQV